ncbi:hypothetical protein [Kitasatospora sp. NPDC002965]
MSLTDMTVARIHVTTGENRPRTHLRRPEGGDRATAPAGEARVAP